MKTKRYHVIGLIIPEDGEIDKEWQALLPKGAFYVADKLIDEPVNWDAVGEMFAFAFKRRMESKS